MLNDLTLNSENVWLCLKFHAICILFQFPALMCPSQVFVSWIGEWRWLGMQFWRENAWEDVDSVANNELKNRHLSTQLICIKWLLYFWVKQNIKREII